MWNIEVCSLLLDNKAGVTYQSHNGSFALCIAAQNGSFHVCALLFAYNSNVNQQNNNGVSRLWIAAHNNIVYVCNLLLENKSHLISRIKMVHLHCTLQPRMVMFTYPSCYFRTTLMLINK